MADSVRASATFTRPNDTTQYAAGDIVANNGTAAQMTFAFDGNAGRPIWLRRIKITKSDPDVTGAVFRLWLHKDSAVSFTNNDNGALAIASTSLAIADVIVTSDVTFAASLTGAGDVATVTFDAGLHLLPSTLYGFLEARGTYTPGAQEVFTVELVGDPA